MSGMALIAGDAVADVLGVREECLSLASGVAGEATRGIFFRGSAKGEHGMFLEGLCRVGVIAMSGLDGVGVSFSGPVAGFAALDELLAGDFQLGVRGFQELGRFGFVAGFAFFDADVLFGGTDGLRKTGSDRRLLGRFGLLLGEGRACCKNKENGQERGAHPDFRVRCAGHKRLDPRIPIVRRQRSLEFREGNFSHNWVVAICVISHTAR